MNGFWQQKVLLVVLCVVCLTGCHGNTTKSDTQDSTKEEAVDGVVQLRVWAEESNYEVLTKMIESFKEEYAGEAEFEITLEEGSDSGTRDMVLGDIHNAADVFAVPDDQITSMAAAGALAPVPNQDDIMAANLEEACEAVTVNGTMYAYPMTADNGYFMYYNKKYFTEKDVQKLDSMLKIAAKKKKKITMEWTSGWYMYAFFGNTGMEFGINEDGVTNYCNWNTKKGDIKGVDVAKALIDIAKSGGFESRPDGEFVQGVQDGTIIAGVSGVWNAVEVKKAWGDNYAATKLPTYTCAGKQIQMSSFSGYKSMGVNYYSKHRDWALKLADWFTNEENQILRFKEREQGPSNINAAAAKEVQEVPAINALIQQSQYANLQRVGNNYWAPFEPFGNTVAEGNPEGIKLQELMDNLVAGITASTVN